MKTNKKNETPVVIEEKDITLSIDAVREQGIQITVTQNDVLELIVSENWNKLLDTIEGFNSDADTLQELATKELDTFINSLIKKQKFPSDWSVSTGYMSCSESLDLLKLKSVENRNSVSYELNNIYPVYAKSSYINIEAKFSFNKLEFISQSRIPCKFKISESLKKQIEDHNQNIKNFYDTVLKDTTESRILKIMKSKMTKEILKSTSKEFKSTLKSKFNVDI